MKRKGEKRKKGNTVVYRKCAKGTIRSWREQIAILEKRRGNHSAERSHTKFLLFWFDLAQTTVNIGKKMERFCLTKSNDFNTEALDMTNLQFLVGNCTDV